MSRSSKLCPQGKLLQAVAVLYPPDSNVHKVVAYSKGYGASLQDERLKATVKYVYQEVPFYRHVFQEIGIEPDDIKAVDDLGKLPFTTKNDLRDNYPYGLFAEVLKR